jgi:hypothetical protein
MIQSSNKMVSSSNKIGNIGNKMVSFQIKAKEREIK